MRHHSNTKTRLRCGNIEPSSKRHCVNDWKYQIQLRSMLSRVTQPWLSVRAAACASDRLSVLPPLGNCKKQMLIIVKRYNSLPKFYGITRNPPRQTRDLRRETRGEIDDRGILPETLKQFGCSLFDGPFLRIISRVFDVRRDFLTRYFVRQFEVRSEIYDMFVSSSIFACFYFRNTRLTFFAGPCGRNKNGMSCVFCLAQLVERCLGHVKLQFL